MPMVRLTLAALLVVSALAPAHAAGVSRLPSKTARLGVKNVKLTARAATPLAPRAIRPSAPQGARALAAVPDRPQKNSLSQRIDGIKQNFDKASRTGDSSRLAQELANLYDEGGHPLPASENAAEPVAEHAGSKRMTSAVKAAFETQIYTGFPGESMGLPENAAVRFKDEAKLPRTVRQALREPAWTRARAYKIFLAGKAVYAVYRRQGAKGINESISLFTVSGELIAHGNGDDAFGILWN